MAQYLDPALLCKAFFTLGTVVGLGGTLSPTFRQNIMNYGSRSLSPGPASNASTSQTPCNPRTITRKPSKPTPPSQKPGILNQAFDFIASLRVPHTYFIHYYLASVLCSLFWAHQILTHGLFFRLLSHLSTSSTSPLSSPMTANQVLLAWTLMFLQGLRRLSECLTLAKPSSSKMWIGLWLVGGAYYVVMSLAVWIEGIATLGTADSIPGLIQLSRPSTKTLIALPLFIASSAVQHSCHVYLASLKKYTLPQGHFFQWVVCPHYTAECLIYLSLALIAAPPDQLLNKTTLSGLGFVVSNLAVTADSTQKWYTQKFGVTRKWRMVPYVY